LLARQGAIVPLNLAPQHFAQPAYEPGFAIFPPADGDAVVEEFFVDDGESEAYREGHFGAYRVEVRADAERLFITLSRNGQQPPPAGVITLLLPAAESRPIEWAGAALAEDEPPHSESTSHRTLRVRV
jgi:alpha-glucosidase